MGAYENPAIIRDRSGEIYGQAIQSFGKSISQGIMSYAESIATARKEKENQDLKDQNIWLEVELDENEKFQENLTLLEKQGKGSSLYEGFEKEAENLLNGTDVNIGAKQARYRVMTQKNLSQEKRQEYLGIINKYRSYMGEGLKNMGSFGADAEDWKNNIYNRSNLGKTFTFKGSGIEKTRNMFTYFAITAEGKPKGITYEKKVYSGADGENMIYVKTKFNQDSNAFKSLPEDQQKIIRDNNMSLEFNQNWAKWRDIGFITEIQQGIDAEQFSQENNWKDEKTGGLNDDYQIDLDDTIKSSNGLDTIIKTNLVNTPLLMENLYIPAKGKSEAVLGGSPEEQNDYVAYTLGIEGSKFDRNSTKLPGTGGKTFQDLIIEGTALEYLTNETQELFLKNNLTQSLGSKGKAYVQRKATQKEADAINKLNKDMNNNADQVIKDQLIYKTEEKGRSYKTPESSTDGNYTKTQVANSAKVNKNWTKNESVLKGIFNSLTAPGPAQPPAKKVMADFAKASIAALPIYGEDEQLIGYELKNQLVSTKPSQILIGESSESINQAIKVASGLSYSIGTEWGDLMSDDFSMFEE